MSKAPTIRPLSTGQQHLLQQLLALQVVTDSTCQKLYQTINQACPDNEIRRYMGETMEHCLGRINASLVPGFGMEIRTIEMSEEMNGSRVKKRYHAVVNRRADDISKHWGAYTKTPHEIAFIKLILQRIVESEYDEKDEEDEEEKNRRVKRGMGSSGKMHKIDLINLRNELDDVHKQKITLIDAERSLMAFCREGWLVSAFNQSEENNNDSNTGGNNSERPFFKIGPRTYMELPGFMEKILPMGAESLPQFILHRR